MNVDVLKVDSEEMVAGRSSFDLKKCMQQTEAMQLQPKDHLPVPKEVPPSPSLASLPEGRVHGGSLLALLASGITDQRKGSPSDQGGPYMAVRSWM